MRRSRFIPGAARDDERVPVAEARAQRRELDGAGEHAALLAQVAHRVLGELLERLRHAAALLGERARELVDAQRAPGRDAVAVPEDAAAADGDEVAFAGPRRRAPCPTTSISSTPPRTSSSGPGFGKRPRLRRRAVDDDARAGVEQLLRRDAVDVAVVDDRDVAGLEPAGEPLRPAVEARRAGELDEAHCFSVSRNSAPPSIRSSSAVRSSAASWLDARVRRIARDLFDAEVAVGDACDLRQVRDRDHLRALGGSRERATDGVRGLAADARVDLVEDERVAAGDDRDRERDPRELAARRGLARPARAAGPGSAGSGTAPRRRRSGRASRGETRAWNSPSPRPSPASSAETASANRGAAFSRAVCSASASSWTRASRRRRAPSPPSRRDRRRRRARPARRFASVGPREQLLVGLRTGSAASRRRCVRARASISSSRPGSAPSVARNERSSDAVSRRRSSTSRSSSPARASSGASDSSGATARSASRGRGRAAPSPSSGASASAAAAAPATSSSRWRSRSRCSRSSVSVPGSSPSVSSTSARSSSSRSARRAAPSRKLLVTASAPTAARATPCARSRTKLAVLRERVEHVELERRPREPALLELPGHRDQPAPRPRRRPRAPRRDPRRRRACGRP